MCKKRCAIDLSQLFMQKQVKCSDLDFKIYNLFFGKTQKNT